MEPFLPARRRASVAQRSETSVQHQVIDGLDEGPLKVTETCGVRAHNLLEC